MVDFKKRLKNQNIEKKTHPRDIYESLDRASDKGPLRPIQGKILDKWFDENINKKDVILKLHTGQGKTIVGLLMLQSKINQDKGPALYLCHNNYLVDQTCRQAQEFGINYCVIEDHIPDDFIDGKTILITSVQKLFNGESKFKIGARSLSVSTILMDDAHACLEVIRKAFKINLPVDSHAYQEIFALFSPELQSQGAGTFADIKRKHFDALLPVPYWDWRDKHTEVSEILSKYNDQKNIKYTWPLIKDMIKDCLCVFTGKELEIIPYLNPLHLFGSFNKAEHRIFMSATITDDSFFIKGLGLSINTVKNPLYLEDEGWSGEKMVLIPSLIDPTLERSEIVNIFSTLKSPKSFGVVTLVPSFNSTVDWQKYGAKIAKTETIYTEIDKLLQKQYEHTLVIANRYDGIDLPDQSCRILIIDSKPYFESLHDRYIENCISNSEIVSKRLAQIIEQGMGRAVRGEKDYCVIILTGSELVRDVRSRDTKEYFSQQTRTQIEIGLEIAKMAKEDKEEGDTPRKTLIEIINQSLRRDEGWKEFYVEQMNKMPNIPAPNKILDVFELEKKAEEQFNAGNYQGAVETTQQLIDKHIKSEEEKGWYMQDMARYIYPLSKAEANRFQIAAHRRNRFLLKPKEGMELYKINEVSISRIENIKNWVRKYETQEELQLAIDDIVSRLRFGVVADKFEQALDELARALGFVSQRPDKEWKEGPDNLWKISDNQYMLFECKNNVDTNREEINKDECGQMNNSCAWFTRNYGDSAVKRIMIVPTRLVSSAAGFNVPVEIMRENKLKLMVNNVRKFYKEFKAFDLKSLSDVKLQELLVLHKLTINELISEMYSDQPKPN